MDLFNYDGDLLLENKLALSLENYRAEFLESGVCDGVTPNRMVIKYVGPGSLEYRFSSLMKFVTI